MKVKNSMLITVFGLRLLLSPGHTNAVQTTWQNNHWACDLIEDQCRTLQHRLLAGFWTANFAFFDTVYMILREIHTFTPECGPNRFVGTIPSGESLVVFMGYQAVNDKVSNQSLFFEAGIEIHQWTNSTSCTGTLTFIGADFPTHTSPIGTQHQIGYGDKDAACTGSVGDPTSPPFHLSDVEISRPSGSGTQRRCYNIKVWGRVCTSAYTNCQPWTYSSGDVLVDWL